MASLSVSSTTTSSIRVKLSGLDQSYNASERGRKFAWKYKKSTSSTYSSDGTTTSSTNSAKSHTYSGLDSNTNYDFRVTITYYDADGTSHTKNRSTSGKTDSSGGGGSSSGGGSDFDYPTTFGYIYYDVSTGSQLYSYSYSSPKLNIAVNVNNYPDYIYLGSLKGKNFDQIHADYNSGTAQLNTDTSFQVSNLFPFVICFFKKREYYYKCYDRINKEWISLQQLTTDSSISAPIFSNCDCKGYQIGTSFENISLTGDIIANSTCSTHSSTNPYVVFFYEPKKVQLTYDANGGSTPPNPVDIPIEQPYELSESLLIKNGYVFKGWRLNKNDTNAKIYLPGESIIIFEATTIYAVWWPDFHWQESYLHLNDANTLSTYIHNYIDSSMTDYILPTENIISHNWYNKLANIVDITNVSAKDVITKNVLNFLSDGYKNFNQKWKNFSIFKKSPALLCNCINYRVPGLVKDTTTNNLITVGSQGTIYRQPYVFNENLVQINKSVLTDPSSRLFNNPSCIEFDENYNRVVIGYNNNSLDFEKERYVDFYNPNAGVFNAAKTVSSQLYNCNGLSKLNSGHVIFCGESKDSTIARVGYMSSSFTPMVTTLTPTSQGASICSATCFNNSPLWLTKAGRIQYASFTNNGEYQSHVEGLLLTTDSSNVGKKIYNINNNVIAACLFNSTTSLYTIYYKENQAISDTITDDYQTITLNKFPTAIIFYNQAYLIFYEDGSMEIRDTLQMATGLKANLIQGYTNALVKDVRIIDNRLFITIWYGNSQENSAIFYYNLS